MSDQLFIATLPPAARDYYHTDSRYQAMIDLAEKTGWPICSRSDLFGADLALMQEFPRAAFVWVLRPGGSRLFLAGGRMSYAASEIRYHSGQHPLNKIADRASRPRFYHVTQTGSRAKIKSIAWQQAVELVAPPKAPARAVASRSTPDAPEAGSMPNDQEAAELAIVTV